MGAAAPPPIYYPTGAPPQAPLVQGAVVAQPPPVQGYAQPPAQGYAEVQSFSPPPVQGYVAQPPPPTFDPHLEKGHLADPVLVGAAPPPPAMHTVVVPPGAVPGTMANFPLPDGRTVAVLLPPNAVPGATITLSA